MFNGSEVFRSHSVTDQWCDQGSAKPLIGASPDRYESSDAGVVVGSHLLIRVL